MPTHKIKTPTRHVQYRVQLNTTELVNDISRTIGEQSLASNEIAHQVEMIAGMSEGNSKVINQTASTTDELSTLAGQLSQSVDRFRL